MNLPDPFEKTSWFTLLRRRLRRPKIKTMSQDGRYFYIHGHDASGWLGQFNDEWLPFVFWKVKRGSSVRATNTDVYRYRQALQRVAR